MTPTEILNENAKRNAALATPYNPHTGQGSFSVARREIALKDYDGGRVWLPVGMLESEDEAEQKFIKLVEKHGSFAGVAKELNSLSISKITREDVAMQFARIRIRYDFEFWAYSFIKIKPKAGSPESILSGGADVPFKLNRGQRKFLKVLMDKWNAKKPIRIILLKARQWGGSTLTQIFMMWIQFVHFTKWNSVICAHVKDAAGKIEGLYKNAIDHYPWALDPAMKEAYTFRPYMGLDGTRQVSGRGCTISIGSAERPNSLRSSDVALAHFSEVAFYKTTEGGRSAEAFVRNVSSSVAPVFGTMIVFESTADGVGDFFHSEWVAATKAKAQEQDNPLHPFYEPIFIAWYDIESYALPIEDYPEFVKSLNDDEHRMFSYGATLEQIQWYRWKASDVKKLTNLKAEYPSTDVEAFITTGRPYFPIEDCKRLEKSCRPPQVVGEIQSDALYGEEALNNVRFVEKPEGGRLKIWTPPDCSIKMASRYVAVVDVNRGISRGADNGIICVFDRYWMAADPENGRPEVVAEWCGHEIMSYFAWTAAKIAKYYDNAFLVIESNTPESTGAAGYLLDSVLDEIGSFYDNMYYRVGSPQNIADPPPRKIGFQTNRQTKPVFCAHHQVVLANDLYIERCLEAAIEHETFEYKDDGSLGAASSAHDDRLITRALGIYIILKKMDAPVILDENMKYNFRKRIMGESSMI